LRAVLGGRKVITDASGWGFGSAAVGWDGTTPKPKACLLCHTDLYNLRLSMGGCAKISQAPYRLPTRDLH